MTNEEKDQLIRAAIRDAKKKDSLETVAAITALPGGVEELKKILNSTEEISYMSRSILGIHLNCY